MTFEQTQIDDVYLHTPEIFNDSRGSFFESFRQADLPHSFKPFSVAQVNNSVSNRGVIRGIHLKTNPPGQRKFVSVSAGAVFDVALDMRITSPTFGKWQGFVLSQENSLSLLIGNGIGHSFLSLEDGSRVTYLCDTPYEPQMEFGINPFSAGIDWLGALGDHPVDFKLSEKDAEAPTLAEFASSND